MMKPMYSEPSLGVLVLDYLKPEETRRCLESVKQHLKIDHKVIYLHQGPADHPAQFLNEGLVDYLIQPRVNTGLGIGTRDLFAACQCYWSLLLQNDQFLARDLTEAEFHQIRGWMGGQDGRGRSIYSISLAGAPGGENIYSERAHLIQTAMYKRWEDQLHLSYHGAGPYHDGVWRERQIQDHYRLSNAVHLAWPAPLVADNGTYAIRDMREAGVWVHRTDSKRCWNLVKPTVRDAAYPKFTEAEWDLALTNGWPDGIIPEQERGEHSFVAWPTDGDDAYVARLRERFK